MNSRPGYGSLRAHRSSEPGARYFLTLTTHARATGLNSDSVAAELKRQITSLEADQSWIVHGAVIMPDHVHLLVSLGERLTLGQSIGRLKAKTTLALSRAGVRWQGNYFEHRLKTDDPAESVLHYIFLNPYRANLLKPSETYSWFWLGGTEAEWFRPQTNNDRPFPEWLR